VPAAEISQAKVKAAETRGEGERLALEFPPEDAPAADGPRQNSIPPT
jgi:hypothetical protein